MPRKIKFENLKPVKFAIEGVLYTIPAAEFARICDCAISGTRASIKEKIAISKLTEDQLKTVELIGQLSAQFGENKQQKKSTFTLSAEQAAENKKYDDFMKPYIESGKAAVGRYIYSGDAKTEEDAQALINKTRSEYEQSKTAKVEEGKMTIEKYRAKPIRVMTDKGEQKIPLHEFVRICPCSIKLPEILKK
ncbi:MAG: hypothetical protein PHN44_00610 [Candidatus Marinimicrobia bacterium]|nr:hypothetical protein [Candidatus Neomarinimicrobiota bacterium]MDD5539133.1 hypothetical protein [Candidatus Neomarinimicrobiota bacterium]